MIVEQEIYKTSMRLV